MRLVGAAAASRGRTILRILLVLLALLLVAGGLAWRALRPPEPLAPPAPGVVLADVTVVNPGSGRLEHRTVRALGDRIASIEATGARGGAEAPFAGRTVLPGLVDMHVHFPPPMGLGQSELFAFLFLYHGVTTVRDAGDIDGTATAPVRDGVREGRFAGPRVFACGYFLDGPGALWPHALVVRDAAEAAAAVQRIAAEGYDCVKVYDGLSADALAGAKREAAKLGLPVIGHVPRAVPFFDAHLDDVQHFTGIGRVDGDLRPFPKGIGPWADLTDADLDALARRIAAAGIAVTPTLVSGEGLAASRDPEAARRMPAPQLLPRIYRDVVWSRDGSRLLRDLAPEDYARLEVMRERERRLLKALSDAGAEIHAGSDTLTTFVVPGASLHEELRLFVRAGLTPEQAWAAATRASGAFLGRRSHTALGVVEAGGPADLLVFREDPTRDLAALGTLEAVVAAGRLYPRAALDAQLARYRAYADGRLFDAVSVAVTRRVLARVFEEDGAK
jgi:imidazolonepropionase-like amidohydrolase